MGDRIVQLRIEANLTQEAVISITGLGRSTVQNIERGNSDPQLSSLLLIADAIGVPAFELLRIQPPPTSGTGEPAGGRGVGGPPG